MSKITWGSNRELNKYEIDIKQYYKNLAESWNKLSDHISEPTDRRTKYYYAYHQFFDELLYITKWKKMGISNREIAKKLEVSEGTIRNFLKVICF